MLRIRFSTPAADFFSFPGFIPALSSAYVLRVAAKVGGDVLEDDLCPPAHGFVGGKSDVRGENGVWCREQGIVCGKRGFCVKDVDACSGNFSFGKGTGESFVVHDRSPGTVDEECGRFHQRKPSGVDQMMGFGGCGNVQGNDVAVPQESFQRDVGDAEGTCRV